MHDSHKLDGLVDVLKHVNGYLVVPAKDEELVILRKEEFDKLKGDEKEVQLELEDTANNKDEISEHELEMANHELDMQGMDSDMDVGIDEDGQLGAGPRKKVRFEPLRGDLSPELQE